jgi:uncharacterized protein YbcI
MDESGSNRAQQIARAARAFEQEMTGRLPASLAVVLSEDTVVITLRGTFSPAEAALARNEDGAAWLRELHRQLFATASEPLRRAITRISGAEVREATTEVQTSSGTVVQVFSLAHAVPADRWSGTDPGPEGAATE